ncbi:hypothetical protein SINU_02520, partial [Sporolactobacillus inulinus CASD]
KSSHPVKVRPVHNTEVTASCGSNDRAHFARIFLKIYFGLHGTVIDRKILKKLLMKKSSQL